MLALLLLTTAQSAAGVSVSFDRPRLTHTPSLANTRFKKGHGH